MNNIAMFGVIQDDLNALEAELLSVVHSPVELITHIGEHLVKAGGKRLRPALYLICARSRCDGLPQMMPIAVALELIHMATLVHDDVIDAASTRRGRTTANSQWGNHSAVLTGDYLFARAFSVLANNVDHNMLKILTDVICSLCEGEIIQNKDTFNPDQTEETYLVRIAKKTADFIEASCQLGGLSAGLPAADVDQLRRYGYSIGMAFQITDDILDITASSEQIGKPAGNDLRQGIVTMPVIYALRHSADRKELRELISTRNPDEKQIKRELAIVRNTEGIEYSYQRVADYLLQARNNVPESISPQLKEALFAVADFVGLRKY